MIDSDGHPSNDELVRIVVRALGNPLPLGMFAFSVGTVLLAGVELKWIPPAEGLAFCIVLLAFVAPLEIISCIFGFLSRDAATGATMGIFGAGWVTIALYYLFFGTTAHTVVMGMYLIVDSIAILLLGITASSGKALLSVILFLAGIRFILSGSVEFGAGESVRTAAGAIGLLLAVLALYGGLAMLLEDLKEHPVLPVFRLGKAKASTEGTLEDQIRRIHHDAGVREQL